VPYVYVALCPRVLRSVHHASPAFPWNDGPTWANRASWRMNDFLWNKATLSVVNAKRSGMGLAPIETLFGHVIPDDSILAADPTLSPLPPDLERVSHVGPLFMADDSPLPDEVEEFLDDDVVYLGFGSMDGGTSSRAARAALDAVPRAGLRAVISPGLAPTGAPARCLAAGPLNHSRLFARVRAIVHHGGAGTFHAAALSGVPQVVVPQVVDQFYWAGRARALGIGVALPAWRLTPRALAEALRTCIEDGQMQGRAREVASGIALDGPERCAEVLEKLGR
jgi:vancomycin aglycone glucosyltransferase